MVVHVPALLIGYILGVATVLVGFWMGQSSGKIVSASETTPFKERRFMTRRPVSGARHVEPGGENDFIEDVR